MRFSDEIRHRLAIVATIVVAVLLFACTSGVSRQKEKNTITVSIPPQKYMLEKIVGDKFKINTMIAPGVNPETYDPSMNHLMALENSAIYFRMGNIGFETAVLSKIEENFPDLDIVNSSAGISLITGTHGHHHGEKEIDPHVWTSVKNARIIAENMYETIVKVDSENKEYYTDRYNKFVEELNQLDDSVSSLLSNHKGDSFLVWHPSLSYFAKDYGLEQLSMESDGKEASVRQYADKLDNAHHVKPKVFFYQKEYDNRKSQQLADELGLKVVEINLMGYEWEQEILNIANALATEENNRTE